MSLLNPKKILLIKHGSLGDIVFALEPILAIHKKFNNSIIVKTSLTKGIFFKVMGLLVKTAAAKIGKLAFFDPDIFIDPDKIFFPLMISFCINNN